MSANDALIFRTGPELASAGRVIAAVRLLRTVHPRSRAACTEKPRSAIADLAVIDFLLISAKPTEQLTSRGQVKCILASTLLRRWCSLEFRQSARPRCLDACRGIQINGLTRVVSDAPIQHRRPQRTLRAGGFCPPAALPLVAVRCLPQASKGSPNTISVVKRLSAARSASAFSSWVASTARRFWGRDNATYKRLRAR